MLWHATYVRAPSAGWRRAQWGVVTRGRPMRRSMFLGTAAVMATGLLLAGCSSGNDNAGSGDTASSGSGDKPSVGVILPDTKSSARWETADAPLLKAAFEAAGVDADIQNAQGDKTQFQT